MESDFTLPINSEDQEIFSKGSGAPNKSACVEALDAAINAGHSGSALRIYLRNFKAVNDIFGHQYGSLLIFEIAGYLGRESGFDVFRLSGVEFAIILDQSSRSAAEALANRILERFSRAWQIGKNSCICQVAIGYAGYSESADKATDILDNLAYAVELAKKENGNRAAFFSGDSGRRAARAKGISNQLNCAINKNLFDIRYRPVIYTPTGRYVRAECLLNIDAGQYGLISAQDYIPIAEQSGQIGHIIRYAVNVACKIINSIISKGVPFEAIVVPLPDCCILDSRFMSDIIEIKNKSGIPPHTLSFAFPESVLEKDVRLAMFNLSGNGIELAVQDFGGSGVEFERLLPLPISVLKMERTLIWQMESDQNIAVMVGGLIAVTKSLGLKLIVEGVEAEGQVETLRRFGSEYEQGFYYSALLNENELISALGSTSYSLYGVETSKKGIT